MKEYYKAVQEGFVIIQPALADFVGREMSSHYYQDWWNKVRDAVSERNNPKALNNVMLTGTYSELVKSLDMANILKIIDREWNNVFRKAFKKKDPPRAWVIELLYNRHLNSHIGSVDISADEAIRALDTMIRVCSIIDYSEEAQKIQDILDSIDKDAEEGGVYEIDKPGTGNLFAINDKDIVEKTNLTRKLTINGETKAYPVYKVRLDQLFYNDRNDRIATWIEQYSSENEKGFANLSRDQYNRIIESFIKDSNPEAIIRTKNNIERNGQEQPGIILADGRVVDGNRRFTCLRLLHDEDISFNYFETVILDASYENSEKEIKKLELAIQHGEESKVAYDSLNLAIGNFIQIEERQTLTVDEYAENANEKVGDVRKRLDVARLIIEFLEFMNVPRQYDIAREMDIYSCFAELPALLRKCKTKKEEDDVKNSVFCNAMMGTFTDQRKYIRDLKSLSDTAQFKTYVSKQKKLSEDIIQRKDATGISDKETLDEFIAENEEIKADLQNTLEKYLLQAKRDTVKNRPSKTVSSALTNLKEIDIGIFGKLTSEERRRLREQLEKLRKSVDDITEKLDEIEYSTSSIY